MCESVVVGMARALPAAENRPAGGVDALVFDALRVFEARRGALGEATAVRVAHWCGIGVRQAKDAIKRLRVRELAVAVGRIPGRTGHAQTYRARAEVCGA